MQPYCRQLRGAGMKVCIMTLGCKVNKYESDVLQKKLLDMGIETTDKLEKSDVYIINTCAVTAEAEKKSRQMIARCKKFNRDARIIICGCASEHNDKQFKIKGVDVVSGVAHKSDLISVLTGGNVDISPLPLIYEDGGNAFQTRTRTYIKIQDGCNNFCTYCIIPYLRGRSRSRDLQSIIKEVESLPSFVQEIVLTGIDVTDYKIDGKPGLLNLLQILDKYGKRIRLSSIEQSLLDEDFIKNLSKLKNFCPHFHLSLQSGSDSVLKRMNRKYTTKQFYNCVKAIRKYFPLAGITTDVIVGFPDESEEEFKQTVDFIKKVNFSSLHIFKYSKREGTVAARLMQDLPMAIKDRRSDVLEEIKTHLQKSFVEKNKRAKVLVEEKEDGFYTGYSENYIKCFVESEKDITNQIVDVQIGQYFNGGAKATLVDALPKTEI